MQVFQNPQQFFNYISSECSKADDPNTTSEERTQLYSNAFTAVRTAMQIGFISKKQYLLAHSAIRETYEDPEQDTLDMFGHIV